jgi:hypothetical protein
MPRRLGLRTVLVALASFSVVGTIGFERCGGSAANPIRIFDGRESCEGVLKLVPPSHYVTATQLRSSNALVRRTFDDVVAVTSDKRRMDWSTLSGGHPVLLVFIKEGCPCSVEFEPYFHRIYDAYHAAVRVLGVIDGAQSTADRFAAANSVPYPVVADPHEWLIGRFEAKNGGYVALLDSEGVVAGFWPGFSEEAMSDLGRRMSRLAGVAEQPIATAGLPKKLTTGCPFDIPSDDRGSQLTSN